MAMESDPIVAISDAEFGMIAETVERYAGIHLSDSKRSAVSLRLGRRVREIGLSGVDEYCRYLRNRMTLELPQLVNVVTTNLTSLFREHHHFEILVGDIIPWHQQNHGHEKLRIWSAGCSTGLEPWSIAITLMAGAPALEFELFASDIDTSVLEVAERGVYPESILEKADNAARSWFLRGSGTNEGQVRIKSQVRDQVTFARINLMSEWAFAQSFHVIFCRNVVIYFERDTKKRLVERFADTLVGDGHLFMGHSESLYNVTDRFELIGKTHYRRAP